MPLYKIKNIQRFSQNKTGQPYKDRKGNPFVIVKVNVDGKNGELQATGFDYKGLMALWNEGDTVNLIIEKGNPYNGVPQFNFRLPSKIDELSDRLDKIEKRLDRLDSREKGESVDFKPGFDNPVDSFQDWADSPPDNLPT